MTVQGTGGPSQSDAVSSKRALRPRDAATLVIFDCLQGCETRILMGRRRMDQVFLPGHYVFPGGRVDFHDKNVAAATPLHPDHLANIIMGMSGRPSAARAMALALAAVRETFEETGYVIGRSQDGIEPAARNYPAAWQPFLARGLAPALGDLIYFARAITPPGRPRRYDTRFFAVPKSAVGGPHGAGDGELEDIGWRTLDEVRRLKLPSITRLVLADFTQLLAMRQAKGGAGSAPIPFGIPFYFQRKGVFQRAVLSRTDGKP